MTELHVYQSKATFAALLASCALAARSAHVKLRTYLVEVMLLAHEAELRNGMGPTTMWGCCHSLRRCCRNQTASHDFPSPK